MKAKSLPKLKKQALDLYSELVKYQFARDGKLNCYTCDKPLHLHTTDCQLGHYLSRGAYPNLVFHTNNSRLQCIRCNVWLHGNTVEFRIRLIAEIGIKEVEELEAIRHYPIKLIRSEYEDMIESFKQQIKEIREA